MLDQIQNYSNVQPVAENLKRVLYGKRVLRHTVLELAYQN